MTCAGNEEKDDKYLARAYVAALDRAKEKGLEAVGFSLLSMLSCQGVRTSHQIKLQIKLWSKIVFMV